jgi:hypothetical protein
MVTLHIQHHTQHVHLHRRQHILSPMGINFPHLHLWLPSVISRPQVSQYREEQAQMEYVRLPKLHNMACRGQRLPRCYITRHICKCLVEHSGRLRTSTSFLSRSLLCATRTQRRAHLHAQVTILLHKTDTMTHPLLSIMAGKLRRKQRHRDITTWLNSGRRHIILR